MPLLRIAALCAAALGIAGCANYGDLTGSRRTEQHLAASCRRWDAMAATAAHPDAATIARHDKLMQQAVDLEKAAVNLQGPAREAAIRNIAQAHIEAAAEYDASGKRRIADLCWENLGMVRQEHQEMARELMQSATEAPSSIGPPDTSYRPLPTVSAPPSPPPSLGPSNLSDLYAVQHGDIRLFSPDGPVIGQTTQIGPTPPPTTVLVPVP